MSSNNKAGWLGTKQQPQLTNLKANTTTTKTSASGNVTLIISDPSASGLQSLKGGRQRLHGAFQGGFSAGYYNTVGSREGWTPQQFKSGRRGLRKGEEEEFLDEDEEEEDDDNEGDFKKKSTKKQKTSSNRSGQGKQQLQQKNAFDFMDEEDIQDFGAEAFTSTSGTKGGKGGGPSSSLLTENFDVLGSTAEDLKRRKILGKIGDVLSGAGGATSMGSGAAGDAWVLQRSSGGGVRLGERLVFKMGYKPDPENSDVMDSPKIVNTLIRQQGESQKKMVYKYGRGYNPLLGAPEFQKPGSGSGSKTSDLQSQKKLQNTSMKGRGSGFGVGIFEQEDEEDFGLDERREFGFSSVLEEEGDEEMDGERGRSGTAGGPTQPQTQIGGYKGCVLVRRTQVPTKRYPLPKLPENYKPLPPFQHPLYQSTQPKSSTSKPALPEDLSKRSIFSFISLKNKERLDALFAKINGSTVAPPSTSSPNDRPAMAKVTFQKPKLPPPPSQVFTVPTAVAQAALKGYKPFITDTGKQGRYEAFLLDIVALSKQSVAAEPPVKPKKTEEEAKESRDFAKAAMIFQPSSSIISSRFTSETGKDAVEKVDPSAPVKIVRTEGTWTPSKKLCIRYALQFVNPTSSADNPKEMAAVLAESKQALNPEKMRSLLDERDRIASLKEEGQYGSNRNGGISIVEEKISGDGSTILDNLLPGDKNMEVEEEEAVIVEEKPSMDLFKAIFCNSDSSDDEEEVEEPKKDTSKEMKKTTISVADAKSNSIRSPPLSKVISLQPALSASLLDSLGLSAAADKKDEKEEEEFIFFKSKKPKTSSANPTPSKRQEEEVEDEVEESFRPVFKKISSTTSKTASVSDQGQGKRASFGIGSRPRGALKKQKTVAVVATVAAPAPQVQDQDDIFDGMDFGEEIEEEGVKRVRPSAADFM